MIVHVDWSLLLVFMVMFIDVHLLTQLPALHRAERVGTLSGDGLWLTAIGLSQVISNVPSTILLLNYVPPSILLGRLTWAALACCRARWPILSPCVWPAIGASGGASISTPFQCCYGRHSAATGSSNSAPDLNRIAPSFTSIAGSPFGAIFLSGSQKPIPAFAYLFTFGI